MHLTSRKPGKKRNKFARALFLSPIAAAILVLFNSGGNGGLLASVWHDPLSVIAGRSPGEREAGVLVDTKPALPTSLAALGAPGTEPWERVLGPVRHRPGEPLLDDLGTGLAPQPLLADLQDPGLLDGLDFGSPTLPALSPSGARAPSPRLGPTRVPDVSYLPNCCDTTDPVLPVPEPGTPTDPASPVPEPGTWLMHILGMLAVGGALRHRNRRDRRPLALLARPG